MGLLEDAQVTILLADHIAVDGSGKATVLGAGFNITQVGPQGTLAPMHIMVFVEAPVKYEGHDYALSLELRDELDGSAFQVVGPSGGPEPLRVQQICRLTKPVIPNVYLPASFPLRNQIQLAMPPGLPLKAGHDYAWQVQIDGQHRKGWLARFHVLGPPPGPVFGGTTGPTDIPNIKPI